MFLVDRQRLDPVSRLLSRGAGQHGSLVLMYHSIAAGKSRPGRQGSVSEAQFAAQLDLLQDWGWTSVTLGSLSSASANIPQNVVITFDDGYADNRLAFEMLAKRGMQASWFIVTDYIGKTSAWPGSANRSQGMLSEADLREFTDAGMEIGSHTATHCCLTDVNASRLEHELMGSRDRLADILDRDIVSFAYPYGAYDERARKAVVASGYHAACTTRSGWALVDSKPMEIRRLSIYADDGLSAFARKLAFATNDAHWSQVVRYMARAARNQLKKFW